MNWITKLERKYGRFCIPNLINILIGGQILVYAIELFVNQYISFYLSLSRSALFAGQIWRLFTFVLVPFSGGGPLSVVLGIYFTWFVGSALEREWGDFRFNLYVLLLFFVIPLKVKYFGIFAAALWVFSFLSMGMLGKLNYLLCMLGFLLFFGPQAWHNIRAWVRREQWKRKNRR